MVSKQIQKGHSNIIVTKLPNQKNIFDYNIPNLIKLRDSIGEVFLPGRNPESFMISEKEYLPYQKKVNYYGIKMLETRGTWRLKEILWEALFFKLFNRRQIK